ncbi:MAG: hypothetical protein IPG91_02925 [Ideonella sp.]|nr:hypothetical protein [Ideonella sp.]
MTANKTTITNTLRAAAARRRRLGARLWALALGGSLALGAAAQDQPSGGTRFFSLDGLELTASPYTLHFHPSDEHEYVYQIGLIKHLKDRWIVGANYFSNSFGQPSGYVYVGQRYDNLPGFERWYLQWNVGILYGYVEPYENKVPFNVNGFSPGFVPSVGYKFTDRIYGELDLLGTSGLMFSLVFPLGKSPN